MNRKEELTQDLSLAIIYADNAADARTRKALQILVWLLAAEKRYL